MFEYLVFAGDDIGAGQLGKLSNYFGMSKMVYLANMAKVSKSKRQRFLENGFYNFLFTDVENTESMYDLLVNGRDKESAYTYCDIALKENTVNEKKERKHKKIVDLEMDSDDGSTNNTIDTEEGKTQVEFVKESIGRDVEVENEKAAVEVNSGVELLSVDLEIVEMNNGRIVCSYPEELSKMQIEQAIASMAVIVKK